MHKHAQMRFNPGRHNGMHPNIASLELRASTSIEIFWDVDVPPCAGVSVRFFCLVHSQQGIYQVLSASALCPTQSPLQHGGVMLDLCLSTSFPQDQCLICMCLCQLCAAREIPSVAFKRHTCTTEHQARCNHTIVR